MRQRSGNRASLTWEGLTVRHCCGGALPPGEGVAAHEVGALGKGVVQGVEEARRGGREQVADVLLQRVDALPAGRLGDKAVVVYGVDIPLLGHLGPCKDTMAPVELR